MTDPYTVLGVSPSATDAEIKKAYRELARKYHPDNYQNNPLADLASEKMKQINEAYDTITKSRANGGGSGGYQSSGSSYRPSGSYQSSGGYQSSGYQSSGYGSGSAYQSYTRSGGATTAEVRAAINAGDLNRASQLLEGIDNRDAEWNFLMGCVYYRRGWLENAHRYFQQAVNMNPANPEYRQALNSMVSPSGFQPTRYEDPTADACRLCSAMLCMNMLCCR